MKRIIMLLMVPVLTFSQAQNPEQRVESPVKAVTLYLDGAEINQQKSVNVNAGITSIVFTNLSSKLIPKSIQVNVGEGISVLSVSEKLNFLSSSNESAKTKQLKDSLKNHQYRTSQLVSDRDAYDKEKDLLLKNNSIGGADKGVSIAELKLAADFYRSRMKEINGELLRLDTRIAESQLIANRLQRELYEFNINDNKPTGEIIILLQTENKAAVNIDLKYVVSDAGWAPFYELKAEDIGKPITLVYRARAFNNTGISWENVKLKLSTSDPTRNATQPSISPWFLNFNSYTPAGTNYRNDRTLNDAAPAQYQNSEIMNQNLENQNLDKQQTLNEGDIKSMKAYFSSDKQKEKNKVIYEQVQISELSAEFDIKKLYSVPCDAKPYIVEVTSYTLNASFKHYSVPKVEKDAFLLARITGWEDLDLIEGPANVYFAGTFVGQSYINPRSVNDTLDLSFGRDSKVIVTRTKIKDFNKEYTVGNNRKLEYSYQMIIKNNRKSAINIDLEDQLPISQNSEISVESIELSKGLVNKDDGKVSWKFSIGPGESQKIIYTYSIRYPKNRSIEIEKKRVKMRAKF
ncbi:hypothetical protein CNR22_21530 [Sphingobacteriaceae bacterium]|nr:hypothetical protein CNR22_21530 [Sphingobacteriaceae bacterium]